MIFRDHYIKYLDTDQTAVEMILGLRLLVFLVIPLLADADHCGPLSENAEATIDHNAGHFVVLAEINNTTQKYCQDSCCDILETDGCNTAMFHQSTGNCTLIRCENEKCSLITDSNFTTTSIGVIKDGITTNRPLQNTGPTSQIYTTVIENNTTSTMALHTQDEAKSTTTLKPPTVSTTGTNNTPVNISTSGKSATTTQSFLTTILNNITQNVKTAATKPTNKANTVAIAEETELPVSMPTEQHPAVQSMTTLPLTKLRTSTVKEILDTSQGIHDFDTTTSSDITEETHQAINTTVGEGTTIEPSTINSYKATSFQAMTDIGITTEPNTTAIEQPSTEAFSPISSPLTHAIPPTTSMTQENATIQQTSNETADNTTNATQKEETTVIPTHMLTSQTNRTTIPTSEAIQATTTKASSTTLVVFSQSIPQSPSVGKETNISTETSTTTETLLNTTAAMENQTESSNSPSSAPAKHFFVSQDDQLPALLIAASSIGIIFIFTVFVLLGKRVFDSWQRRHYSRIDYLINGMYN